MSQIHIVHGTTEASKRKAPTTNDCNILGSVQWWFSLSIDLIVVLCYSTSQGPITIHTGIMQIFLIHFLKLTKESVDTILRNFSPTRVEKKKHGATKSEPNMIQVPIIASEH